MNGSDKILKKTKKIIAIILALLLITYIFYAIHLLIKKTTDTYIIKKGTLSNEDSSIGFIIRNEQVIKEENYKNGIYAIVAEGDKVAKDEAIFRYYSDNEKEISTNIKNLNNLIQEKLEQEKKTTSADIKAIENQIDDKISKINTLSNYQEISEYQKSIDNLISKKIKFIGDVTENKEIKQLINERNKYEEKLKNGSEYKTASMSGIVSYRVDGLEEKLSEEKFDMMTEEYFKDIDLKTGQIISASNECGKVIDNFKCYIAVTIDTENAMKAKVGDNVRIRTSNKEEIKAKIIQINEQDQKRTIIFQVNKMTEGLINYRKIALDIIWWDKSGLKVPNQALIEENGLYYILRNKAGIQTKILVKIEAQTDKFSIISSYSSKELQELGYDGKAIRNYKNINNYDEIIVNLQ